VSVSGQYVRTFAEASHALPIGMHMDSRYPFMLPRIIALHGGALTVRDGENEATAHVCTTGNGERASLWQPSEGLQDGRWFLLAPFKDEHTPAIGDGDAKDRDAEVARLTQLVASRFRCFGGGSVRDDSNPISIWTKDDPASFAAGVKVAEVVAFVLENQQGGARGAYRDGPAGGRGPAGLDGEPGTPGVRSQA
jgi:hypothetical protein